MKGMESCDHQCWNECDKYHSTAPIKLYFHPIIVVTKPFAFSDGASIVHDMRTS